MRVPLLLAAVLLPVPLGAQQSEPVVTLLGRVADGVDSGAVAHATINVVGTDLVSRTDGWGYFRIDGLRPGHHELLIRALGYARLSGTEDFAAGGPVHRDYYMSRVPQVLTEMVVQGRAMRVPHGFEEVYRRGARGWGTFITREQIDSLNPIDLKSMLVAIPGVHVNDRGVSFPRCPLHWLPQVWIDGTRMTRFGSVMRVNESLSQVLPADVQAMEVYHSVATTPAEFLDGSGCGIIAIWTKRGP